MKKDLTEVVFILDRSGSMYGLRADTVGGFNSMVDKQKAEEGEALVSAVLFNDTSEVLYDRVDIRKIEPMTETQYVPGGTTALIDALGDAIHHIGNVHKYAREEDVPEHTLFIIMTDGMENASHRYSADDVREKVKRQQEKYGWEFLFLGANIDAVETAKHYGFRGDRAARFHSDEAGTKLNYAVVSETIRKVRMGKGIDAEWAARIKEDYQNRN